ncbi:MAG: LPS assembly lipoprotein LptE [Bacteroidales bacterium]
MNSMKQIIFYTLLIVSLVSCTISYKFNGASIDYTKVKTISIQNFPIKAALVYAPLAIAFDNELKDIYTRQTRLNFVKQGGDLQLEGTITRYDLTPQSVQADAYAAQTRLTIGVSVRFTNKTNPKEDFEQSFSAFRDFNSNLMLNQVQDQLIKEIVEELTDQIYNATVAKW